jgi:crotonobetaine/carnitine-CoA ligase
MTSRHVPDDWHLARALERRAEQDPNRDFVRVVDGPIATYGEVHERVMQFAGGLRSIGVMAGDKVVLMAGNTVEFVVGYFAIVRLGAIAVPMNLAYKGRFLEHIVNNSDARFVVAETAYVDALAASWSAMPGLERLVCLGDFPTTANLSPVTGPMHSLAELSQGSPANLETSRTVRETCALMYTSGTTGLSKGVLQPHGQVLLMAKIFTEHFRLGRDDVIYTTLPLFHINALGLHMAGAMHLGIPMVVDDRFHATRWLDTIRRYGATTTNLLGVMGEFVLKQPIRDDDADNPLRVVNCVPIAPGMTPVFEERFGARFIELYGTTEVTVTIFSPFVEGNRDGAAGKVIDEWFEAKIVDPETDVEVPDGDVGEMVFRPRVPWCFMQGYYNNDAATVNAWRNFWFHTGDAGKRDEDGYFYFVDRMRDCLRRRGENISSFEVESVLAEHAAVREVAVIGVDSGIPGGEQEVMACVVLAGQPSTAALAKLPVELTAHCVANMPRFAVPRYLRFVASLPKTPTEKVQKQKLRDAGVTDDTWDIQDLEASAT